MGTAKSASTCVVNSPCEQKSDIIRRGYAMLGGDGFHRFGQGYLRRARSVGMLLDDCAGQRM
jgi:hypothetical protein